VHQETPASRRSCSAATREGSPPSTLAYGGASGYREPGRVLRQAPESMPNLKGKTGEVAPHNLKDRPDLVTLLAQLESSLKS